MIDFIPLEYYTAVHYHVLLLVAILILFHSFIYDIDSQESLCFFNILGYIVIVLLVLYMGLRPVNGRYFGDTSTYAKIFETMQQGQEVR